MLEQEVSLTEWERRKEGEKKIEKEALLMLLCRCFVTAEGHYAYCKLKGFSWKYQGTKMKRWVHSSLHMAGSDVAMLEHTRPCSPRWLQFAWPQSDHRHLSQSVAFTDRWSRLRALWDRAKCRHGQGTGLGLKSTLKVQFWPDQNFTAQTDLYFCEAAHKHR